MPRIFNPVKEGNVYLDPQGFTPLEDATLTNVKKASPLQPPFFSQPREGFWALFVPMIALVGGNLGLLVPRRYSLSDACRSTDHFAIFLKQIEAFSRLIAPQYRSPLRGAFRAVMPVNLCASFTKLTLGVLSAGMLLITDSMNQQVQNGSGLTSLIHLLV
jgi:hypothetical protein